MQREYIVPWQTASKRTRSVARLDDPIAAYFKVQDVEFASIMVQNLNNNLITAPELAELRKRLRNLDTRV